MKHLPTIIAAVAVFALGYISGYSNGYDQAAESYSEVYEAIIGKYRECYEDVRDELNRMLKEQYETKNQE